MPMLPTLLSGLRQRLAPTPGPASVTPPAPPPAVSSPSMPALFGRPGWTFASSVPTPGVAGPGAKLARGSGRTGGVEHRATSGATSGYTAVQDDYRPSTLDYLPGVSERFAAPLPRSIGVGTDGRELVGTYTPHAFAPATRFMSSLRQPGSWQQMAFPPNWRSLIAPQQVARYNLYNVVAASRPPSPQSYFLGYQMQPQQAAAFGGNGMGRPLGN